MKNQNPLNPRKFPNQIIDYILKLLPVKTLLRFRCVSKQWCALISSPRFIKSHLKFSSTSANLSRHRVIIGRHHHLLHHASLQSVLRDPIVNVVGFENSPINPQESSEIRIVGSCNGLVCILVGRQNFILWNPSTGKFRNLPKSKFKSTDEYGFGFDESNDDYKVFAAIHVSNMSMTFLYSLKRNSWKTIDCRESSPSRDPAARFARGGLYWVPKKLIGYPNKIPLFDLAKEVFGKMIHPYGNIEPDNFDINLWVFDGCIGVCYYFLGLDHGEAWVLRQNGIEGEEYWEKSFSISYMDYPFKTSIQLQKYFWFAANGEILMSHGSESDCFLVYRMRDKSFRRPQTGMFSVVHGAVTVYVESLVSVNI